MKKRLICLLLVVVTIVASLVVTATAAIKLTITYDANGATSGSVPVDGNSYEYNESATVLGPGDLAKTGYTFGGWWSTAKLTTFQPGDTIKIRLNYTLVAVWNINSYDVSYTGTDLQSHKETYEYNTKLTINPDGGTYNSHTSSYEVTVEDNFSLGTPSRTGYTFKGWSCSKKTFTANWAKNTVVLTYSAYPSKQNATVELDNNTPVTLVLKDGSYSGNTTFNITKDETVGTPTKPGYTFEGWTWNDTAKSLTANWNPITYTISYDMDCSDAVFSKDNPTTYTVESATFSVTNPTRPGYEFKGWTDLDLTINWNYIDTISISQGSTGNRRFKAHWDLAKSSVKLNANGGSFVGIDEETTIKVTYTKTYGDSVGYSAYTTALTRTGYDTTNWYNDPILESGKTAGGQDVIRITKDTVVSANPPKELYMHWKAHSYTIEFDPGLGTGTKFTLPCTYDADVTLPTPTDFTCQGYVFDGWSTTSTGIAGKDYSVGKNTKLNLTAKDGETVTLYAKWKATTVKYKAEYYVMDLDGNYPETASYIDTTCTGTTATMTDPPELTSEKLSSFNANYFKKVNLTNVLIKGDGSSVVKVYYERKLATVTYGSDLLSTMARYGATITLDFSASSAYPATYKGKEYTDADETILVNTSEISIPNPTRTGYTFVIWTKSPALSLGNFKLDASWVKNTHNVTYKDDAGKTEAHKLDFGTAIAIDLKGGKLGSGGSLAYFVADDFTIPNPSRDGYTFDGWSKTNIVDAGFTLEAQWTANTDTKYAVEYYIMDLDGNYPDDPNYKNTSLTGTTDTKTNVPELTNKEVSTFVAAYFEKDGFKNVNIDGDGKTVVKVYYARKLSTVTYGSGLISIKVRYGATITIDLNASLTYPVTFTHTAGGQYDGEKNTILVNTDSITIVNPTRTGHTFLGWLKTPVLSVGNFTLKASWALNTYKITYREYNAKEATSHDTDFGVSIAIDLNGGKFNKEISPLYVVIDHYTIPDPTRDGYTFDGWSKTNVVDAGFTLEAKWTANTDTPYAVEYYIMDLDGNYPDDPNYKNTSLTGTTDTKTNVPELTNKEVSTFVAAYFEKDGFKNVNIDGDGKTVVKVYYARKLSTVTYKGEIIDNKVRYGATITLDLNDSTTYPVDSKYSKDAIVVKSETIAIPDPTREGYTFLGWSKDPILYRGNFTLKSLWQVNTYKVNYREDTGTVSDHDIDFGTIIVIDANKGTYSGLPLITVLKATTISDPTRAGYTFDGWKKIDNKEDAGFTLEAQWTANIDTKYTVKYYVQNLDGTIPTEPSLTKTLTGMTDTQTNVPDLTDTMLSGFNPAYFDKRSFDNLNINGNESTVVIVYYDRKVAGAYYKGAGEIGDSVHYGATITLDLNDSTTYPVDSKYDSKPILVESETIGIPDPTREGYTFLGWSKDPILYRGNFTLKALWQVNTYKVNYREDTGTVSDHDIDFGTIIVIDANKGTYSGLPLITVLKATTISDPTRAGYTFDGWKKIDNKEDAGFTLEAQWTAKTDTPYAVEYYIMDVDGSYSKTPNYSITTLTGTTDTKTDVKPLTNKEVPTFIADYFLGDNIQNVNIDGDGKTVVKVYYARKNCLSTYAGVIGTHDTVHYGATITLDLNDQDQELNAGETADLATYKHEEGNGGSFDENTLTILVNGENLKISNPTRDGYTFAYWVKNPVGSEGNFTLKAKWTANDTTRYTINYFLMGLDGKYTETATYSTHRTATTSTLIDPPHLTKSDCDQYESDFFTLETYAKLHVLGSGKTTFNLYYSRKAGEVSYDNGGNANTTEKIYYGATVTLNLNDDATVPASYSHGTEAGGKYDVTTKTVLVNGATLTIAEPTRDGYVFIGWDSSSTADPLGDVTLTAQWKINTWTTTPDIDDVTYGTAISPVGAAEYGEVTITYEGTGDTEYSASANAPTDAGTYKATFSVPAGEDYEAIEETVNFTIEKKEAELSWSTLSASDLVYSKTAKTLTATVSNLETGDLCDVIVALTTGDDNINVGSFTYTASSLSNANYKLPTDVESTEYTITQKEITVSGITATNRDYVKNDTSVELVLTLVTLTGKIDGDDLSVTATGSMTDDTVGNDKPVTISDLTLTGTAAGNYKLASTGNQQSTTVDIAKLAQNQPNASKSDETIKGKADGKLTGVTDAMEYKLSSAAKYTKVANGKTSVEDLKAGTYLIRYAATDVLDASDDQSLVIASGKTLTVTFKSMGGSKVDAIGDLEWEATVDEPKAPTRADSSFNGWYLGSAKFSFSTEITDDITLEARWTLNKTEESLENETTVSEESNNTTTKIQVVGDEGVKASGLENVALEVKENGNDENNVKVVLTAEKTSETDAPEQEVIAIKGLNGEKEVDLLDINLTMFINDMDSGKITDTNGKVIEVLIPFTCDDKENIVVYRYHGSDVDVFTEARTEADMTYFIENDVIHLFTSKFCTFGIGYTSIEHDDCVTTGPITAGNELTLLLGNTVAGVYTIKKDGNSGYQLIDSTGKYVSFLNGSVSLGKYSYTWKYDGGLYAEVKTTTRSGFWIWSYSTTTITKYYLTTDGGNLALSNIRVCAGIEKSNGQHVWSYKQIDADHHMKYCKNCSFEGVIEEHHYGSDHTCECGKKEPTQSLVTGVEVIAKRVTVTSGYLFWTKRTVKYQYTIKPVLQSGNAAKVEYCVNGWWYTGTSFTSDKEIGEFKIRVTDSNGTTATWKWNGGTVTSIG